MLDKPLFMLYNTSLDRNNKLFKDNLAKLLHGKGITYLGTRPSSVKNTKSFAFLTVKYQPTAITIAATFSDPERYKSFDQSKEQNLILCSAFALMFCFSCVCIKGANRGQDRAFSDISKWKEPTFPVPKPSSGIQTPED